MSARPTVLLTGVTGFVGREILFELLVRTRADVISVIRADDHGTAGRRLRAVVERLLGPHGWRLVRRRLVAIRGDLTRADLGIDPATRARVIATTTHIVHGAASVRFDLPLTDALAINLGGTASMLGLAGECLRAGHLQRFGYVSTAYVSGRHPGIFRETDLDIGQSFRNTYEQSKFEAELLLRRSMYHLPVTVVRPSIVVGHSRTGATTGFNVIYWPLRMYADRRLVYAPTRGDLPVDVVPVDFVARGVVEAVVGHGRPGTIYTLAAGHRVEEARVFAEMASDVFGVPPPRFVATPLDRWVLPAISRAFRVGPWSRRAAAFGQYLPYFIDGSRFDTTNADGLLRPLGIEPPPAVEYLRPILEFAQATRFGRDKDQVARREAEFAAQRHRVVERSADGAQRAPEGRPATADLRGAAGSSRRTRARGIRR